MAKRRRLVAPDKSELEKIDKSFAAKPPLGGSATAPIAQVAAESAALSGLAGVGDRVAMAKDTADAVKWRDMNDAGLAVQMIALNQIDAEYLRRDRVFDDPDAMNELRASIKANGLRSPIEVVATDEGFGLVSGQRRLNAFLALAEEGKVLIPFLRSFGIMILPERPILAWSRKTRSAPI
jgi:ParB family chromosome partitioning protein